MSAASPTTSPALTCGLSSGGDLLSTIDQVGCADTDVAATKQTATAIDHVKILSIGSNHQQFRVASLGRRSVVRIEEQLHRDLGRTADALRDTDEGRQQGYPNRSFRADQASEDDTE